MIIRRLLSLAAVGMLFLSTARMEAQVVLVNQPHVNFGNPATGAVAAFSNQLNTHPAPIDTERAQVWENFTLSAESEITQVDWTGSFNDEFNPNDDFRGEMGFLIKVYGSSSSGPNLANELLTRQLDAGTAGINDGSGVSKFVLNELTQRGGSVLNYSTNGLDPFTLDAGNYWLSIIATQTFPSPDPVFEPNNPDAYIDPNWAWHAGSGGDDLFYQFDGIFDASPPGAKFSRSQPNSLACPFPSCDMAFTLFGNITDTPGLLGDFNNSGVLDVEDIDLLSAEIRAGSNAADFDLTGDGLVNREDHSNWIVDQFGTLPGDATLDRSVLFGDFVSLAANFGQSGGWGQGDFDATGNVVFGDFVTLAANFGLSAPVSSATASVPEPACPSILMAVVSFALLLRKNR